MHYYIDGYNMLFRLMGALDDEDLQNQREQLISDLNQKVSLVKIDVSIVFDSAFQVGGRSRSHFNELEILFTAEGETADEFILDELKNSRNPHQETVITSDKKLAWHARHRLAHTESVENFIGWLNKAYKNKLKKSKNTSEPIKRPATTKIVEPLISSPKTQPEQLLDYYAHLFETRFEEISKEEQVKKEEKKEKRSSEKPQRKLRKKKPKENKEVDLRSPNEMERWLKIFEERFL